MILEVHMDWQGKTHKVGRLFSAKRGSAVSFQYSADWLNWQGAFAIDPTSLPLGAGMYHSPQLFGAMQDCGPDRWGKLLIERAVRKKVLEQKPYQAIDYVLCLDDSSRIGALRFCYEGTESFLAAYDKKVPPLVRLGALLNASDAIHGESESAKDLRFLLGEGSPLGGARPKSTVLLPDGRLAIAKFPKMDDLRDIEAGEVLALTLAQKAGICVAEHRLVSVEGRSIAVITRFDRQENFRIPFLSAATLLAIPHGDAGAYTALADGIRQFGHDVPGDLRELWCRLVFSLLASNTDDHMHNHGFLMIERGRWALSPAYDLNPVPQIDQSSTPQTSISEDHEMSSLAGALHHAGRFGIGEHEAKAILRRTVDAVHTWRSTGRHLRIKAPTLDAYASAFEHGLMDEARQLLRSK